MADTGDGVDHLHMHGERLGEFRATLDAVMLRLAVVERSSQDNGKQLARMEALRDADLQALNDLKASIKMMETTLDKVWKVLDHHDGRSAFIRSVLEGMAPAVWLTFGAAMMAVASHFVVWQH
jgi:hypothetical protein